MARWSTTQAVISFVANNNWGVLDMEVKISFFNIELKEV
jgi:hypothetical protein